MNRLIAVFAGLDLVVASNSTSSKVQKKSVAACRCGLTYLRQSFHLWRRAAPRVSYCFQSRHLSGAVVALMLAFAPFFILYPEQGYAQSRSGTGPAEHRPSAGARSRLQARRGLHAHEQEQARCHETRRLQAMVLRPDRMGGHQRAIAAQFCRRNGVRVAPGGLALLVPAAQCATRTAAKCEMKLQR